MKKQILGVRIGIVVLGLVVIATGCSTTDFHDAVLYKKDSQATSSSTSLTYLRPSATQDPADHFNGNVIQVPRGRLAQFGLKEVKVGWLADRAGGRRGFPQTRALPERTLWLVIQIEGFKADDFLRTSGKRSFIASAVKQNQNSEGYLALDTAESNFSLQTSDWQYEVTFTLYSVDNFKLKQILGYAVKDNKSLLVTGYDALKQLGGSTYSFIADPIFRSTKHQFGEEFLFERVLLTANAVTEFKGMVYIVGQSEPLGANPPTFNYVLADLTDVPGKEALGRLGKLYLGPSPNGDMTRPFLPFRDPVYRSAYSETFTAINAPVSESFLRHPRANVLRFDLSVSEDKNKQQALVVEQLNPLLQKVSEKQIEIRSIVDNHLKSLDQSEKELNQLRDQASRFAGKIQAEDSLNSVKLEAAAQYKIETQKFAKASEDSKAAVVREFELDDSTSEEDILKIVDDFLSAVGILYLANTANLTVNLNEQSRVSVGSKTTSPLTPSKILAALSGFSDTIGIFVSKMKEYRRGVVGLTRVQDTKTLKTTIDQLSTNKIQMELQQAIPATLDPGLVKVLRRYTEYAFQMPVANLQAPLEDQFQILAEYQNQINTIKQQGVNTEGSKFTIF
jgi:hypothetical protein